MTATGYLAAEDRALISLHETSLRNQIVATLNVKPPDPSSYAYFLAKIAPSDAKTAKPSIDDWVRRSTAQGDFFVRNYLLTARDIELPPTPGSDWWPKTFPSDQRKTIMAALVSCRLRTLVDEWLDTGVNAKGESPGGRSIKRALSAHTAVHDFMTQSPLEFLADDYSKFVYPPDPRLRAGNVFESRDLEAIRLFANLIISDWKTRLCKCRHPKCGKYFLHPKPRRLYVHGTFCRPEHQRDASARPLTTARRSEVKSKLTKLAAEWLADPDRRVKPIWKSDPTVKDRLVRHLNDKMSRKLWALKRTPVTKNWVTRNRADIERELAAIRRRP